MTEWTRAFWSRLMAGLARPACPWWCEGEHSLRLHQFHAGGSIPVVHLDAQPAGDAVGAYAAQRDGEPPCVLISGRINGRNEPDATFSAGQAAAVARVVELLATASPDAHRGLAAAIRYAITVAGIGEDRS